MFVKRDHIESLKASLSITLVAERLGYRVIRGKIRCPYPGRHAHGDRTPSVSLSEEKGLFNCWVCPDVRGDVIRLVEITKNISFPEAVRYLEEEFKPWDVSAQPVRAREFYEPPVPENGKVEKKEKADPAKVKERSEIIYSFLKMLSPIEENTPAARYLASRKIFKKTWQKMLLRVIHDYPKINSALLELYGLEKLQGAGLFNDKGHLRYYKHPLIFPYLDEDNRALFFQARAIEAGVEPKELNLRAANAIPYNKKVLNGEPGWVYLCEGVIDTLTLIDRGFEAVGIPGVKSFKHEWVHLFKNKKVVLCLDQDEAGRNATAVIRNLFTGAHIECVVFGEGITPHFQMKEGQDINDLFRGKRS
ncbi:MAG: toprim domain-containing protein [Fibrobacter sp.]|jgi:DNA primase|nr:toprim domain-containing protein [Fibrobacter sp.]